MMQSESMVAPFPRRRQRTMMQSESMVAPFPRRRPRTEGQHSVCSTASEAAMKPTEGRRRRPSDSASHFEITWQEHPISRVVRPDRPARMLRMNRSSGMKSLVVGIIACVCMWDALDRDSCGGGLPLLSLLPVADAYELYNWNPYNWNPDGLSEDMPPGNEVTVEAMEAPPQATPRNRDNNLYIDDDDNISEEDIRYDDDYVSGDATYTNENIAGVASFRGENDGGAGPSIIDPNNRGVPSPRPTRNPTPPPPTPRPTRRPRPRPTPSPTRSPTPEPTGAPVPEPTAPPVDGSSVQGPTQPPSKAATTPPTSAFVPTQAPTTRPSISAEPSASPTAPIPYTFTIQMTPFEITLTSMDDELDGQQLQIFNLFSDKQIEQTWLSRKLENLSEDDANSLADGYVDISFKTVVTSQLLSAPIVAASPVGASAESTNTNATVDDEFYRQSGGGGATPTPSSSPPTMLTLKTSKSSKGAQTPTAAPTKDLDDLVRGRRRTMTTDRRERRRQWQRQDQLQRKRTLKNNNEADDDIGHTSISPSSTIPAVEHTLYLQQTKTAYVTVRGKYLLNSQPEIIPTLNELDTAVQITYGSESPDLVTVLKDYDLEAFDELHGIDFLHFFYPSTVGGVSSIIEGEQKPIQQGKTLNGGAKFGIFLASAVGAALLGLAAARVRRGNDDDYNKPKASSSKKASSDKIKRLCATYSDKMKNRMGKKKSRLAAKSPASEHGADNFLEDQYDEAIFQYEMDSYISSLGLGGISGSFDMEPAYDSSGRIGFGGEAGERRKVRFQEDYADSHGAPTPTANNRSIQRWPSRDGSAGTNLDGVVYLCEKDEQQQYEEQRSTTSQGVEGIFSAK